MITTINYASCQFNLLVVTNRINDNIGRHTHFSVSVVLPCHSQHFMTHC